MRVASWTALIESMDGIEFERVYQRYTFKPVTCH